MNCLGLVVVLVIWAAIVWLLCRMLDFFRLDDDPDERDPYN